MAEVMEEERAADRAAMELAEELHDEIRDARHVAAMRAGSRRMCAAIRKARR